jgi:hypothetical protein
VISARAIASRCCPARDRRRARVQHAFGENRADVQDRHLDPEIAHEGHVVLNDDYRARLGDLTEVFPTRAGMNRQIS